VPFGVTAPSLGTTDLESMLMRVKIKQNIVSKLHLAASVDTNTLVVSMSIVPKPAVGYSCEPVPPDYNSHTLLPLRSLLMFHFILLLVPPSGCFPGDFRIEIVNAFVAVSILATSLTGGPHNSRTCSSYIGHVLNFWLLRYEYAQDAS
jgi:hypothetical protein